MAGNHRGPEEHDPAALLVEISLSRAQRDESGDDGE